MPRNNAVSLACVAFATALLASPALGKCTLPSGQYVGQGAGPIFFSGSTLLGGRNEVWTLEFPTASQPGSITVKARSHPQIGNPASYYSMYELSAPVEAIGAATPQTTWNAASCTGTMRVKGSAKIVWVDANGVGPSSTIALDQFYTFTSVDSARVVTFTMTTSIGPFAPTYSIRLERP